MGMEMRIRRGRRRKEVWLSLVTLYLKTRRTNRAVINNLESGSLDLQAVQRTRTLMSELQILDNV